jgi:hypothetical protein
MRRPQLHYRKITSTLPVRYDTYQSSSYSRIVTRRLQYANAFVIQLRAPDKNKENRVPGRIEHVASGRIANFQSIEELPQLLLRMLESTTSTGE